MAITLVSNPDANLNLVSNPFVFKFNMTGVESGTEVRRIGYQLLDSSDNPITAIEVFKPDEAEDFLIDFQKDLIKQVSTAVPFAQGTVSRAEASMLINVKLKYWESVYDKSLCSSSIVNEVTTGLFPVLNSADQYWTNHMTGASWRVLQILPDTQYLCRSKYNIIYTQGTGNLNIKVYETATEGTPWLTQTTALSDVKSIEINPAALAAAIFADGGTPNPPTEAGTLAAIHHITVDIDGTILTRYFMGRCCETRIAFQDPLGGYTFVDVTTSQRSLTSNQNAIKVRQNPEGFSPSGETIRTEGGLSTFSKSSKRALRFFQQFDIRSNEEIYFLEAFLGSGSYFLEYTDTDDTTKLIKLISTTTNSRIDEDENFVNVELVGYINKDVRLPNFMI